MGLILWKRGNRYLSVKIKNEMQMQYKGKGGKLIRKLTVILVLSAVFGYRMAIAAEDTLSQRFEDLEGKVEAMQEPFLTMQGDVDNLKKQKLSGYWQVG